MATFSGRLKSDFSVTADLAYNAFPFIRPEGKDLENVEAAAQGVLDARAAHPDSSLADLYDPLAMPKDLRDAHNKLDKAILGLYGLKADVTESEILAVLIARYRELTSTDQLELAAPTNAKKKEPAGTKPPSITVQIREWATANGYQVPARGRLPKDITVAWERAQKSS